MGRRHWAAGWSRIGEGEFKTAIAVASTTEPDLCARLRRAIKATAARKGVRRGVRDQYLQWIAEVEAMLMAMVEAEESTQPEPAASPARAI